MRLDNPITDHKLFNMLDVAAYSEVKNEYRQTKRIDLSKLHNKFDAQDLNGFNSELDRIISLSFKEKRVSKKETELYLPWRKKLERYFNFYSSYKEHSLKIKNNKTYDDLFENGCSFQSIDQKKITFLKNRLKNNISELLAEEAWKPPVGVYDQDIPLGKYYVKYVHEIFKNNGVLEAASAYINKKLSDKVIQLAAHTTATQSPKQFLYDCKNLPKHNNLHIDPLEGVVKALIYLSDVTEENGPTQYLPKSNRFIYDPLQTIFSRAISTGSYCQNKSSRASIFRLPKKLRVTTNFGRLIKDGSSLEKYLTKNLAVLTSDIGNTMIFDPGAGVHNGPLVKKGHRISLQVIME